MKASAGKPAAGRAEKKKLHANGPSLTQNLMAITIASRAVRAIQLLVERMNQLQTKGVNPNLCNNSSLTKHEQKLTG